MNEKKAITVVALMTAMLVTITICLAFLRFFIGFFVIVGVFAVIGLMFSAIALCKWLLAEKEEELTPVVVADEEPVEDVVAATVDDIIAEMGSMA